MQYFEVTRQLQTSGHPAVAPQLDLMALASMLAVPMTDKAAWVAAAPSKTIQRLAELPSHSKVPYTPTIASGRVLSVQEVTLSSGCITAAQSDGSSFNVRRIYDR